MPEPHAEKAVSLRVTTAAIRLPNGLIVTMPRPHRHGSLLGRTWQQYGESRDHGFVLTDGSYADRARAYEVAEAAGQIIKHWPGITSRHLFSEHLWAEEAGPSAPMEGEGDG